MESGAVLLDNLLDEMNVEEYEKIFSQQIRNEDDDYTSPMIDHFSEMYRRYIAVFEYDDLDEDKLTDLRDRFERICKTIILCINAKFDTDVDVDRICEVDGNLAGVTLAMYLFFVIDFSTNITSIIRNFITKHGESLYHSFEHLGVKKDVVTASNHREMSEKTAVIASNIYDISDHIFTLLDKDTFAKYCDSGYVTGSLISQLVEQDKIPGNYVESIADIYKNNTDLKARVCFQILFAIKNGDISDTFEDTPSASVTE